MQISEGVLKSQEVLWLPGSLCSFYRIPFDPNPAEQEFPPPCVALILHTGNRIDAVLGSQVFRHLLRLPLPYFEFRPTGTLVARLHGVETIREFVSGAAVTLILDLPFLLIFLAVMFAYSWQLSLIAVGLLGLISILSFLVAPVFRDRLNQQFMLGACNQSFLTEYVSGMATVKSLQMEPSHVMRAMGIPYTAAHGTIRFSLSVYNTEAEVDRVIAAVPPIIAQLRKLSPYWSDKGPAANPEAAFAPTYA